MTKAVRFLVKAVEVAAAAAVLVAGIVMIDTRSLFGLPLLVLAAVAGFYSWRVDRRNGRKGTAASREPILVS